MLRPYYENEHGVLYHGDCLDVMDALSRSGFVADMVLCDPPYGTTACAWDSVIPFDKMWGRIGAVLRDTRACVLFGAEPFSSALRMSNLAQYKYDWVWEKTKALGFMNAKNKPLNGHELASVFSTGTCANKSPRRMIYNPQGLEPYGKKVSGIKSCSADAAGHTFGRPSHQKERTQEFTNYPTQLLRFASEPKPEHPTQKPVALFAYLIQTYTNPGEVVLDFCAGAGTTAVAAQSTGSRWVCIEKEQKYCDLIVSRLEGLKCESTLLSRTTTKARKSARRDSTQSTLPLAV